MLETNFRKASALVHDLLEAVPVELLEDAVIFGSAAITLHGVDLQREIDDLDLFIPQAAFSRLGRHPALLVRQKFGNSYLAVKDRQDIELWTSFPGAEYETIRKNARPVEGSGRLPVASLPDLRAWKQAQGRPKDLLDLRCMK